MAFLIKQLDYLELLAKKLVKEEEAQEWRTRSDRMLNILITDFWNGKKIISKNIVKENASLANTCLLSYIPIILGNILPKEKQTKMIKSLKSEGFITAYGLATESIKSKNYESDGYWRGPIWAPTTFLVTDVFFQSGKKTLALELCQKYMALCQKSGFAENYNALTGEALRDLAYTCSSSVFLLLAKQIKSVKP